MNNFIVAVLFGKMEARVILDAVVVDVLGIDVAEVAIK